MANPEPAVPRSRRSSHRPGTGRRSRGLSPRKKIALVVLWVLALIAAAAISASLGHPRADATRSVGARFRTTTASVGSITRVAVLDGVVVREPDEHVLAPVQGTVRAVDVSLGSDVAAGETIATIELPPPPQTPTPSPSPSPTPSASPSPTPISTPSPSPTPITMDVTAPTDGVVSEVAVVLDQQVAVGQAVVSISPDSFDVIAPVGQALLPQFIDGPLGITVSVPDGQAPFDCEFLSIGANLGTSGAQQVLNEAPDLRCHVPDQVDVVPGIRVRASATTGMVQDVVVLPVTAIDRVSGQAYVWVVEGRNLTQTAVTLGVSDAKLVEITGGLSGGQSVLNPVRGQAPTVSPSPSPSLSPSPAGSPSSSPAPSASLGGGD